MNAAPKDPEAEQIVVGYLLGSASDPEGAGSLLTVLNEGDFTGITQRTIYRGAHRAWTEGVAITTTAVHEALRAIGFQQPTHAELLQIATGSGASRESAHAAMARLRELRRWRSLLEIGASFSGAYSLGGASVDQVIAQALTDFDALQENRAGVVPMSDVLKARVSELRDANGKPVRRMLTGFAPLDGLTGGLGEGDLTVLAAATGGGKTAMAGQVIEAIAKSGRNALVASAEMHGWELGDRLLSRATYVPLERIRDNTLDLEQREALDRVAADDDWRRVFVLERQGALTVQHIGQAARSIQRSAGLAAVVVDYLQLVSAVAPNGERGRTREAEVAAVTRGLKNLAMDLSVPVLALSQFNREAIRNGGEPELHHLRESGEIEQAANAVLFLWHNESDGQDVRRLLLKKHRSGESGTKRKLRWNGNLVAFTGEIA
jgi:replicative DNA helicase